MYYKYRHIYKIHISTSNNSYMYCTFLVNCFTTDNNKDKVPYLMFKMEMDKGINKK